VLTGILASWPQNATPVDSAVDERLNFLAIGKGTSEKEERPALAGWFHLPSLEHSVHEPPLCSQSRHIRGLFPRKTLSHPRPFLYGVK
jgi:hypothetical protein